ncbi:hypothetical protein HK100_001474, partial [Physocladia obscura]
MDGKDLAVLGRQRLKKFQQSKRKNNLPASTSASASASSYSASASPLPRTSNDSADATELQYQKNEHENESNFNESESRERIHDHDVVSGTDTDSRETAITTSTTTDDGFGFVRIRDATTTNNHNDNNNNNTASTSSLMASTGLPIASAIFNSNPAETEAKIAYQATRIAELEAQLLHTGASSPSMSSSLAVPDTTIATTVTTDALLADLADASATINNLTDANAILSAKADEATANLEASVHARIDAVNRLHAAESVHAEAIGALTSELEQIRAEKQEALDALAIQHKKVSDESKTTVNTMARAMELLKFDLSTCTEKFHDAEKRAADLLIDNKKLLQNLAELRTSYVVLTNEKARLFDELHSANLMVKRLDGEVKSLEVIKDEAEILKSMVRSRDNSSSSSVKDTLVTKLHRHLHTQSDQNVDVIDDEHDGHGHSEHVHEHGHEYRRSEHNHGNKHSHENEYVHGEYEHENEHDDNAQNHIHDDDIKHNHQLHESNQAKRLEAEKPLLPTLSTEIQLQSEINLLKSQLIDTRETLRQERHRTELLAMELECLPDYIQLYHRERKALMERVNANSLSSSSLSTVKDSENAAGSGVNLEDLVPVEGIQLRTPRPVPIETLLDGISGIGGVGGGLRMVEECCSCAGCSGK